jgi:hypothetical protein
MKIKSAIGNRQLASLACCFLLSAFALTGCSVATAKRTADGVITVSSFRCLWKTEAVSVNTSFTAPAAFHLNLSVGQSATDSQSVSAVTEGAVKGLTRP